MKIIDAHIHFTAGEGFSATAEEAGHENSAEHLAAEFKRLNIVMAVAMGSGGGNTGCLEPMIPNLSGRDAELPPFIAWCAGVNSAELTQDNLNATLEKFENCLRHGNCVGIKLYPGYNFFYVSDPLYHPFYELAAAYDVPVVIHTGDNANSHGKLKYSHPLTVDDVASDFPGTRFVMAHYGNPWIVDATEVAVKNPNVFIDISGLAVGRFEPEWFCSRYSSYLEYIKMWMTYLSDYKKIMYGSDWPLVNLENYLSVIKRLIPEDEYENVFFNNALRVFPKISRLL